MTRLFVFLLASIGISNGNEPLSLSGGSTFASRKVKERELRLWQSKSARYQTLEISGVRNQAVFKFKGKGGAIARISRIDQRRSVDVPVSMTGSLTGLNELTGNYLWGVYGWILNKKEWDDANVRHEFYVIYAINRKETDPLIATMRVGETVYQMHRHQFSGGGYRFKAIAINQSAPTHPTTVGLTPFLNFWKQHGLTNERYLHEVSWALELLTDGEHSGEVTLNWHE